MKRVEREIYGFGPRLSTRQDRCVIAARVAIVALLLGVLGAQLWA